MFDFNHGSGGEPLIKPTTPPARLSTLMRLGVHDVQKAQAAGAHINMGTWYKRAGNAPGHCVVCYAGAVAMGTLNLRSEDEMFPSKNPWKFAFHALNHARSGSIVAALQILHTAYGQHWPPYFPLSVRVPSTPIADLMVHMLCIADLLDKYVYFDDALITHGIAEDALVDRLYDVYDAHDVARHRGLSPAAYTKPLHDPEVRPYVYGVAVDALMTQGAT